MFLIFDTETTGLPRDWKAPITDSDNWPRIVQLAWQLHDTSGKLVSAKNYIVKPDGFTIPYNASKVHGISTERAEKDGFDLKFVLDEFESDRSKAKYAIGHNIEFDINVVAAECHRLSRSLEIMKMLSLDTKDLSTDFCGIPGGKGGKFKWPTLTELHFKLFNVAFADAHDAAYDVHATARCFFQLISDSIIKLPEVPDQTLVEYEAPELDVANFEIPSGIEPEVSTDIKKSQKADISEIKDTTFSHLHCHSQFSILQSTSQVAALVQKAKEQKMPAIAISDHGNMMAAFNFVRDALKADITPIVGSEVNLCSNRLDKSRQDNGYQTVLLAKNKAGYHNLAKLSSLAYTEGFYYVPRIDKELLVRFKSDLIATTGGLWGEIPYLILNVGDTQAEEAFVWWKEQFGDDFYVELNRHGLPEEDIVNAVLLRFAEKYKVKYFAANNTYYNEKSDATAHDVLLCVKDAVSVNKEKKYVGKRGREFRFGFPNDEFYVKTADEMKKLFADLPEAIETTNEIVSKIERYELAREVLLPKFKFPDEFKDPLDEKDGGNRGENNYLRHLTYEGAKKRYPDLTTEITERIDFELATIERTGYPGYFLIVQDFTTEARKMGVSVGPGRGSAAGSVVAYCNGITNIDPIKYDLLFERFLNPDRVSMPDIDIDFDDEGRQKVIDYVIQKYGSNQVAQIITYGTMAAKSSVKDTGRVLDLPLSDTDRLSKLIPSIKLNKLFGMDEKTLKSSLNGEELSKAQALIEIANGDNLEAKTVQQAIMLEGTVRNTGIHACGVIITPDDITNFVPVATAKDSDMWCTQFDNSVVEYAGLLKMDFLGLKTLTLIKDAVSIVKQRHGIEIDPDTIPLEDEKTYELFQRGETIGIFQYESAGMQKYMKDLKPTSFADLIAMNALYRPGPIEYIPSFIRRKHGDEEIVYDLEASKEYLEETYGITVYQEQVMLLSQKLAGFTKGEADVLRKAMGKKIFALLETLKPKFLDGCEANGHDRTIAEKIWKDWEAFASYAFNKSHSTCYAWIAFQTAYLKANYPAAYMASVLSNNMNDIKQVTFFMEECRRMDTPVLGPDVNESNYKFTVNDKNEIRFGLGAIKGVGGGAVDSIVNERGKNGAYKDIYDLVERIDLRAANKRCFENLVCAGALDSFGYSRSQYLAEMHNGGTFLEQLLKFGTAVQEGKNAPPNLFGESTMVEMQKPIPPQCEPWSNVSSLSKEKEVVGIYISAHPLDDFNLEIQNFSRGDLRLLAELDKIKGQDLALAGIVVAVEHRTTKTNKPFGTFEFEDKYDNFKFFLFGEDYIKYKPYLDVGHFLFVKGKSQAKPWTKTDELEFKIGSIQLLSELRENLTKSITIEVDIDKLNEVLFESIEDTLKNAGSGNCQVIFRVVDQKEKLMIKMPSKSVRIDLSNDTIKQLDGIKELSYTLN